MSKKKQKKKIVRPQYVTREVRIKQAPKKPISKELKIGIAFCAVALVLALVLFFVLYDEGSLPMENGVPVVDGENWIITNVGDSSNPKYYKVGEVNPLPGYTAQSTEELTSDLTVHTYVPEDPDSNVVSYYVIGINSKFDSVAQSANANMRTMAGDMAISAVQRETVAGMEVDMFSTNQAATEEASAQRQLLYYLPAIRNTSVLMSVTVNLPADSENMTLEEEKALAAEIIENIQLEAK